jgi:hypothetical protein
MQLYKAHNQWKTRPADERFSSLSEMHGACRAYRVASAKSSASYKDLRVDVVNQDLCLVGKGGRSAQLSHWAFGQLSARVKAPAAYLRALPVTLAAQNINHGLKERGLEDGEETAELLFHKEAEDLTLKAVTSDRYSRIWNSDITAKLLNFQAANPEWKNPLAYEVAGTAGPQQWPALTGNMVPSGLYASDHDMFAFLVDESKTLKGSPQGLNRGFFVWNSEVGGSSFGFMDFLYDRVCGNNIVWGASKVREIKIRHVGEAEDRAFSQLAVEVKKYADSSPSEIEGVIERAQKYELGVKKEDILENVLSLVGKKRLDLSKKQLTEAIDLAHDRTERYGNPNTLWAVVSGLTEASQWGAHADERVKTDRAAGKLLEVVEF